MKFAKLFALVALVVAAAGLSACASKSQPAPVNTSASVGYSK